MNKNAIPDNEEITIRRVDLDKFIQAINSIKIPASETSDRLLTIKESSKYLRCSVVSFSKIRKEKNLDYTLVGKKRFFRKSVLDEYLGLNKTLLFTRQQLAEKLSINRFRLLQWEIEGKVTGILVGQEVKYRLSEIVATIKSEKKEVNNG